MASQALALDPCLEFNRFTCLEFNGATCLEFNGAMRRGPSLVRRVKRRLGAFASGEVRRGEGKKGAKVPNTTPFTQTIVRSTPAPNYCSIVALVKDEAPNIQEWIEFHLMLGVQRLYIYDNNSSDSTAELLKRYDAVTTTAWPRDEAKTQRVAYAHALSTFGSGSRWMIFIDADEFIFPARYDTLPEALSEYEDLPGLVVPWRMFGHSGHRTRPDGLVIENYTKTVQLPHPHISQQDYDRLRAVKSIVDPTRVKGVNAHTFLTDDAATFHTPNRKLWSKRCSEALTPPAEDDHILLNHYFSKSQKEFEAKLDRGFIDKIGPSHPRYGESPPYTRWAERKKEMARAIESAPIEDRKIQRFLPTLRERMGLANAVEGPLRDAAGHGQFALVQGMLPP